MSGLSTQGAERPRAFWVVSLTIACAMAMPARAALFSDGERGTTAAAFLKFPWGARMAGLGGAASALIADSTAIGVNPAGLGPLKGGHASMTHGLWAAGVFYDQISVAWKGGTKKEPGAPMGVGLHMVSMLPLERYDATGMPQGPFWPFDLALVMGTAFPLDTTEPTLKIWMGASGKLIVSRLDEQVTTWAGAADFGVLAWILDDPAARQPGLAFSFAIRHAGTPMKAVKEAFNLPLTVVAGMAVWPVPRLRFTADATVAFDEAPRLAVGAEFEWRMEGLGAVIPRGGFLSTGRWQAGLGVEVGQFQLDYAWMPLDAFGDTHRISLAASW